MLCHGSLLLAVMVSLVSCFPNPFGIAKPALVPDLPSPSIPKIPAVPLPSVSGGILDYLGLTGLLRLLGLIKTPIINAQDSLPLAVGNGVLGLAPGLPNVAVPGVPAVGGSSSELQDLNRRISRVEAVLQLEGRAKMVGNKMIATSGKEVDFATSSSACNNFGGQLATPMNEEENSAILEFVKKYNRYAYLGLKEGVIAGTYNYLNGLPAVYTSWSKGEPSGKGTEGCVEMYTDGRWNNKACNQNRLTVCQF